MFLRVAFAGSTVETSDGFTVSWSTANATATSTVWYGLASAGGKLNSSATGDAAIYLPLDKGGMVHHHVTITGLLPGTTYSWYCGDAVAGWSGTRNFTTAPAARSYPFSFVTYGDMGVVNAADSMAEIGRLLPGSEFVWHIGDVSYADDAFLHTPLEFHYEKTYNTWMADMEAFTSSKAYMVLPGNHEAECHSPACILDGVLLDSLANFSAYNARWRMPFAASGSTTSMWYSFRFGGVHFVNIDTETDFPGAPGDGYVHATGGFGDQLGWLQADLAAAAADRAAGKIDWILVGGHRPMYTRNDARPDGTPERDDTPHIVAAFEPLFARYGVDLFVAGHVHDYETMWPVANGGTSVWAGNYSNPPYTTHVIIGSAGCDEGHTAVDGGSPQPWSRLVNTADWGLGSITVHDANSLTFNFTRSSDGAVVDSWTLVRQH